jgi:cold shock CspA family protein
MSLWSLFRGSKKKTEQPSQSAKAPPKPHQPPKPESKWEVATVKTWLPQMPRAYLTREGLKEDILVHKSTLKRCRIESLTEGQKVQVIWGRAPKGPEAVELRLST